MPLHSIKDILQRVMHDNKWEDEEVAYRQRLQDIVHQFSTDARIQKVNKHTLVIEAASSGVLQELAMHKAAIMRAILDEIPQTADIKISNIKFTMQGRTK